ncbi:hypothetical protein ES706_04834 [subsurface metagenome]
MFSFFFVICARLSLRARPRLAFWARFNFRCKRRCRPKHWRHNSPPRLFSALRGRDGKGRGNQCEKGEGNRQAHARAPFTSLPSLTSPDPTQQFSREEGTAALFFGDAADPSLHSPSRSTLIFFRAFFSGDGRDVSGDGRRESEGVKGKGARFKAFLACFPRPFSRSLSLPCLLILRFFVPGFCSRCFFDGQGKGREKGDGRREGPNHHRHGNDLPFLSPSGFSRGVSLRTFLLDGTGEEERERAPSRWEDRRLRRAPRTCPLLKLA